MWLVTAAALSDNANLGQGLFSNILIYTVGCKTAHARPRPCTPLKSCDFAVFRTISPVPSAQIVRFCHFSHDFTGIGQPVTLVADLLPVRTQIRPFFLPSPTYTVTYEKSTSTFVEVPLRAENETRTRDPDLGKVVLYQLSYFRERDCKGNAFFLNPQIF